MSSVPIEDNQSQLEPIIANQSQSEGIKADQDRLWFGGICCHSRQREANFVLTSAHKTIVKDDHIADFLFSITTFF